MKASLPPELRDPNLQSSIIGALMRTYETSRDRHDPTVGDDAMTFGIHVSKSGAFYLEPVVNAVGSGFARVVQHSLAMRIGNTELRHHKLGESETDDPEKSFPGNVGPASRMSGRTGQLDLPMSLEEEPRPQRVFYDWVIGSYGNPDDGLRAVRLQAVGSVRALDGTISRWEDVITLYDASAGAAGAETAHPIQPAGPRTDDVVVVPEPEVGLQNQKAAEEESSPPQQ